MRLLLIVFAFIVGSTPYSDDKLNILDESKLIEQISRNGLSYFPLSLDIVNPKQMEKLYETLKDVVYKEPINAKLDENNRVISEKMGYQIDREKLFDQLQQFYYEGIADEIQIPKQILYPKVTRELLAQIQQHKISSYTTYYETNQEERSHNINLATKAIDNTVLFPGETFSFNQVVGERTEERGYKKAPIIIKGELAEGIGGGICQVSSTLFNAVNLNGVQFIERYSHSKEVPYVPPGKDAAVSWWGPDFVFKNNYKEPILIQASAIDGQVYIRIYAAFK